MSTETLIATELDVDRKACHHPFGTATASPGTITTFTHDEEKAPPVEKNAWLPVGINSNKPARGSVSFI